jgi:hypothetical protein
VAGAAPGDHLFFFYSGHGSQMVDEEGDEEDGRDECLVPLDMVTVSPDRFIPDSELRALLFCAGERALTTGPRKSSQ